MPRDLNDAPPMNCQDAREELPALVRPGGMGLTEWALVVAHLRQCGDCRRERASLERMEVGSRQRAASPHARLQSFLMETIGPIRSEATRFAARLTPRRVPLSIPSTVSAQAAIVGATSLVDLLARRLGQVPELVKRGLFITQLADLLARLRMSSMVAFRWAARFAPAAARGGVTRALELLTRVRCMLLIVSTRVGRVAAYVVGAGRSVIARSPDVLTWLRARLAFSFTMSRWAKARTIGAGRVGAIWMADRLASGISAARHAGGIAASRFLTPGGRASGTRPLLTACAGIVSLAILAATMVSLSMSSSPRQPSTGEWVSLDVRLPADRMPAEATAPPRPVETSVPKRISSPAAPAAGSEPRARRLAMRAKGAEAEIPAPSRSGDPSLGGGPAPARAPISAAEGVRSGEPSPPQESARSRDAARFQGADAPDARDESAAIDWLLRGGRGR